MANRPKTAKLLRTFVELFVNGKLLKPLWKFISTAFMIPLYKLARMDRNLLKYPRLPDRNIPIGAYLCCSSVRMILKIKKKGIGKRLL